MLELAVIQRDRSGRGRLLFSERRSLAVAGALSTLLEHLVAEGVAYALVDPVAAARAESDAIRLGRVVRAAVQMK